MTAGVGGIAILGAGLSGLSLAAHLAATTQRPGPVVVVDDGSRDITTAAWSCWSSQPGLLSAATSRELSRMRVIAAGRDRTLGMGRYTYRVVRGGDLDAVVREQTAAAGDISYRTHHVLDVVGQESPEVHLSGGAVLRPEWVFDARGLPPAELEVDAWLDFRGWHVHSEAALFDPEVPTLFDFRTSGPAGPAFMYVLPTDAHHALVEHTCFTTPDAPAIPEREHDAAVLAYLGEVLGAREGAWSVQGHEGARLPLSTHRPPRVDGRVMTVGTGAGMLKASSGYAYERVQRDSAAIADSFARYGHPCHLRTPPGRFARYDRALLRAVLTQPGLLEQVFDALFDRRSAEPVLRFLDEETSVRQEAMLFASLPAAPLVAAMASR